MARQARALRGRQIAGSRGGLGFDGSNKAPFGLWTRGGSVAPRQPLDASA